MRLDVHKTWAIILALYVGVLPFGPALPNIVSALLLGFALFQIIRGQFVIRLKDLTHFLWMNAFILFLIISLMWSDNMLYGTKKLILLFYIPLFYTALMSSRKFLNRQLLVLVSQTFIIANTILLAASMAVSLYKNGLIIEGLTQNNLSTAVLDFHFLGFSLYVSLSLILGIYVLYFEKEKLTGLFRRILPAILVLLSAGLFLLSSRTTIVITIAVILLFIITQFRHLRKRSLIFVISALIFGSAIFLGLNSVLREKFKDAINYEDQYDIKDYWGGRGFRELIWHCALEIAEEHPMIGVGFGDQQDEMELCYRKHRYQQLLFKGNTFNAHNIFLQILIASGVIGLVLFIMSFFYPVFLTIRRNEWLYVYFLILILGTGLTESHFNRNAIVSLFAFFNPLIFFLAIGNENTSDT